MKTKDRKKAYWKKRKKKSTSSKSEKKLTMKLSEIPSSKNKKNILIYKKTVARKMDSTPKTKVVVLEELKMLRDGRLSKSLRKLFIKE